MKQLEELIKKTIHDILEEESTSGDAGAYLTPKAFMKKGQKTNAATKYSEKMGFKKSAMNEMENTSIKVGDKLKHKLTGAEMVVTKVNGNNLTTKITLIGNLKTGKVGDINKTNALLVGKTYDLIKENKSLEETINNLVKEELINEVSSQLKFTRFHQDQISSLSPENKTKLAKELTDAVSDVNEQDFTTKTEYSTAMRKAKIDVFKKYIDLGNIKENKSLEESITNIIKEELLNEVSYNKFKNEVKYRTKAEMLHKSIREVKRKLAEVDQLIEYTTRIKQELSENENGASYWKRSLKAINEISEVSNKISNKIKSIYQ